jgi:multimeric flavodoxin WrbA
VLTNVLVDGAIGTAVGTGIGALAQLALVAGSVSLFVASPLVAPLVMLGWGASLGAFVGAAAGANAGVEHKDGWLSDLVHDAIASGQVVLVAQTRTERGTDGHCARSCRGCGRRIQGCRQYKFLCDLTFAKARHRLVSGGLSVQRRFREAWLDPLFAMKINRLPASRKLPGRFIWLAASRRLPGRRGRAMPTQNLRLSVEWLATKERIDEAQRQWSDHGKPIPGIADLRLGPQRRHLSGRDVQVLPAAGLAREILEQAAIEVDVLDLSLLTSEYGRNIHPCKGCVSTAMPLCHWPCSCYPNHTLNQTNDWMAEIYERWTAAHAVIIVTPVYWYQSPSPLKLMIDRLVCADGGNPDPTSTSGKTASKAKALEMAGWDYPKHLAGRAYGLIVHGDVAGVRRRSPRPCRTGSTGWVSSMPGHRRDWTATSATTSRMRPVTKRWTRTSDAGRNAQCGARSGQGVVELRAGRLQAVQPVVVAAAAQIVAN